VTHQRYIYPMIAPPTPERLEQDKKTIADQFEKTFTLVDQLARDTEALKAAEQDRTERLDTALSELESVMNELKAANRRREDDSQRVRDEIQGLKDSIPAALEGQKTVADNRLKEVNTELLSLKTLISRMNSPAPPTTPTGPPSGSLRPVVGNANGAKVERAGSGLGGTDNVEAGVPVAEPTVEPVKDSGRSSPVSSGNAPGKVSIPAWQLAMANKNSADAGGSS
jgi:peroxin-14